MAYDKDLLYQFQKINGQDIPFVKPQHYDKNGNPVESMVIAIQNNIKKSLCLGSIRIA